MSHLINPFEASVFSGNEDLMRSLPELSRETGLPTSTILDLRRVHPHRVPSVRVGAVELFPQGVIAELKALAETQPDESRQSRHERQPLLSLTRRRREIETNGAPSPAPETIAESQPETPPRKTARKPRRPPAPRAARSPTPSTDPQDLAHRLEALERTQSRLRQDLAELIQDLRRPYVAHLPIA